VKESQRVLRDVLGVPSERIRFVQNQASPYGKPSRSELSQMVGSERVSEIPYGGEEVSKAGLNGYPLVTSRGANPTSKAITALARELDQTGRELVALAR
jgi:Flp pilus assembly CpaE family ATPase